MRVDYTELMTGARKSLDGFMTSNKMTYCAYCGSRVLPQDDWYPGYPEYSTRTHEFEYPALVYHVNCERELQEHKSGAW